MGEGHTQPSATRAPVNVFPLSGLSSQSPRPSVFQVRAQDVTPEHLIKTVVDALRQYGDLLEAGALVSVEEARVWPKVIALAVGRVVTVGVALLTVTVTETVTVL